MSTVFLSYARQDLEHAGRIAKRLAAEGVTVWRDQEQLQAGEAWPKALGEAVAGADALLLLWSARAAESAFVELEWCTALALKKMILPCLLDQTPLPAALASIQATAPDAIGAATQRLLAAHAIETKGSGQSHRETVIDDLAKIEAGDPADVLYKAKAVFAQRNWIVQAPVYQAGGDIHVGIAPTPKSKLERWQAWVAMVAGVLTAVSLAVALVRSYLPGPREKPASQSVATIVQPLAGTISDDAGEPLTNVQVSVLLGGDVVAKAFTGPVSEYNLRIEGPPGVDVTLIAQKDGYQTEKRYTQLGNPGFNFKMRRKQP